MSGKYRAHVIQLYKNLYHLGKEYPNGALWFHNRLHAVFSRNANITDDSKIEELIAKGEYVCKEIEALYSLRKYRAMKRNYYDA